MKKLLFICSALCLCGLTAARAQVTTSAGVKAQANYSKYRLSGMQGTDSKYGLGAGVGGFLQFEFSERFAIQPELLFNLMNSKLRQEGTAKYRYMGLELPVYAVGRIPAGNGRLLVGAGPYVAYGLSNKAKDGASVNLYKKQEGTGQAAMRRFDWGVGFMLGYEFESGFMIQGGYKLGLRDNLRASGSSMKTSAFSLGVGYKF